MQNRSKGTFSRCIWLICQLLLYWLVTAESLAQGQPVILNLTLDSLQKNPSGYMLYTMPWRFQAGDSLRWADPLLDDHHWYLTKTGNSVGNTPPGWQGKGWFRLHFSVDQSLVGQSIAFRIAHVGASDIYLDGERIGGFGKVGHSLASERSYVPEFEPISFRLEQPGEHVLAVRLSSFHRYLTSRVRFGQGFVSWMAPQAQMNRYVNRLVQSNGLSLIPGVGAGLLALLHLFLYGFYPVKSSNLYYSFCLAFFSAAALLVYLEYQSTSPASQQTAFFVLRLVNLSYVVASVAFVYSVCYSRQPRRIGLFYAAGAIQFVLMVLFPAGPYKDLWLIFLALSTLEIVRVLLQAAKRKQPGVWLIGVGMVATAMVYFLSAGNILFLLPGNPSGQNLFMSVGFLLLPFASSLYLAQDFARTSRNLEAQLRQVQALSAQALAQEAEKLRLVASQKQELEQTVQQRTEQLQQQANKLREVNQTKTRFFTNLAHEFRTPLTLMLGPAEQILAKSQEALTRQQANLLQKNAHRLLRLVNQLLDLSKLEAGKTSLVTAPGDLIALVKGMLLSFDSLAEQKQIALQWHTDTDQLILELDRDKLEKIFSNLFSNALKFTPVGGAVSISITTDSITTEQIDCNPWVQIAIQDTGRGIPAEKLPYLFDQFYQVDASDTREQEGFGIGLALTKELVELHRGQISITSKVNTGTLVTVCLPMYGQQLYRQGNVDTGGGAIVPSLEETPLLPPTPSSHVHEPSESTLVIEVSPIAELPVESEPPITGELPVRGELLLIEDNAEMRQFIRSYLEPQYRIWEAVGGEEGIGLARQHVPDLVITDLMMPHMDGYGVCRQLKQDERTSHIPILMLTAKADLDSRIEGLQTGADSYLAKPFHGRELLAQIANLITTRQQLRKRYRRENLWQSDHSELPSGEQLFLKRVRTLIEAHLADEHFGVDQLSEEMALSRTQLHRKLKALIDYSPGDLIRILRLEHAMTLLSHQVASVSEVAYRVGFANPASFSASFSRHFGFSPNQVKKKADTSTT